ncbi:molybdate ABC transporter permease subunit [Aquabacterium sp.]|uniref:molybdate ABC transporter permease subunit n=1 Tax=Aquabacterium sp. TaxID=1872578 RepID=UPI0019BDE3F2|nr:molybdate ABC transporter permease subunit [Aquabacterium sp.]MBC7699922.1 molybdate ABC transporter permease subunit [Aquabacterium sp.]
MHLDLNALWLTLKVAAWATAAAGVLGVAFAWAVARGRWPGKRLLEAVLTLPMVLPPTVLGYYLIVVLGRNAPAGRWLSTHFDITLMFTWQGAVIAASVVAFPLVFTSSRAAFEGVNVNLEKAARVLGAGELKIFLHISLPLAMRGIAAGTMLAFARAMGEFGATLMIAGNIPGKTQTLSMAIYDAVQSGNDALANTLVIVISVLCIVILVVSGRLLNPRPER